MQRCGAILCVATLLPAAAFVLSCGERTAAAELVDIPNMMFQPSVNLVLSVADVEKSKNFYGQVLKLKPMADLHLPGGFVMTRYQVGTSEIKLLHSPATKKSATGKLDEAIGIRRLTLFFPEKQALIDRFEAAGLAAPKFEAEPRSRAWSRAIVSDPDGAEIALIVPPEGTPKEVFNNLELQLTVGDVDKSRQFYRDFIHFSELDPIDVSPDEGGKLYPYRHGNTTILLASFGAELPNEAGLWQAAHGIRYIQYIVTDLDAVDEFAKHSGVTIAQPIFNLGKLARIMFIADPDGVINEFVGLPQAGK